MQILKKTSIAFVAIFMLLMQIKTISALDDGAYLIGCSSSYVNPLTGVTEDGGTNIALGNSMVSSIVEGQLLLEQAQGNMYITVGLGLASNVSNIRFKLMNQDGSMYSVGAQYTGSSYANGDTVNHYRIQISALTQYISPIMYVTPMGRDVQFFIQLNSGFITSGTGVYNSYMVIQENPSQPTINSDTTQRVEQNQNEENLQSDGEVIDENKEESKEQSDEIKTEDIKADSTTGNALLSGVISKESLLENVTGLSYHNVTEELSSTSNIWLYGGIGVVVVGILGGIYYVKKAKK